MSCGSPAIQTAEVALALPGAQDTLCTAGLATTAGAAALRGYVPPYDATAVARLRRAGALVLGKCNCDAFAMGSTTEASDYQVRPLLATPHPFEHVCAWCLLGPAIARHACIASARYPRDSLPCASVAWT